MLLRMLEPEDQTVVDAVAAVDPALGAAVQERLEAHEEAEAELEAALEEAAEAEGSDG